MPAHQNYLHRQCFISTLKSTLGTPLSGSTRSLITSSVTPFSPFTPVQKKLWPKMFFTGENRGNGGMPAHQYYLHRLCFISTLKSTLETPLRQDLSSHHPLLRFLRFLLYKKNFGQQCFLQERTEETEACQRTKITYIANALYPR